MNKREHGSCLIKTGAIRSKRESWNICIHVVLFINWRNPSVFQNIRVFAHFYRRIKNIFQFFGVELTLLLKTFG